jgi:hypothetical protein
MRTTVFASQYPIECRRIKAGIAARQRCSVAAREAVVFRSTLRSLDTAGFHIEYDERT